MKLLSQVYSLQEENVSSGKMRDEFIGSWLPFLNGSIIIINRDSGRFHLWTVDFFIQTNLYFYEHD